MESLAPASSDRHTAIRINTSCPTEFIDLTDRLDLLIAASGIRTGLLNVQSLHTTVGIVVNEHEPLLLTDFVTLLEKSAPRRASYRHDDMAARTVNLTVDERTNGHAHCQALLLGSNVCLNVDRGHLRLGRWQRVFLVELDGPRERQISVVILGEGGR
jgi:secondary thiamine-phosphate synthase enzyme